MTLKKELHNRFDKKLKTTNQKALFSTLTKMLSSFYEQAQKKKHSGKEVFFIDIKDIEKVDFSNKYDYWIYDKVTNLFFNNIHARHEDFRRVLLVLHLVINKWDESSSDNLICLLENKRADLEGIYTALGLGFYATGALMLGGSSRSRIICGKDLRINENTFLRNYMLDASFLSKEDALIELQEYLTTIEKKQ